MASIDKLPSGRWRARWREHAGAPQRSRVFTRKIDAQQFLARVEGDLVRGEYLDPGVGRRTTLDAYAADWMAAQPWRDSTRARSESLWRSHVAPAFGGRPIATLRPSELQAWASGLRAAHEGAEALAPATVAGVVRLLAAVLNAAVADRVIAHSPAGRIRLERRAGELRVPLDVDQVRALAEAIAPELRAAVLLCATAGPRQGELFGLTDDRVGWLRREVVVDRQLVTPAKGAPSLGPCKTPRSVRTVPVTDAVVEALAAHRERYGVGDLGLMFHRGGAPWPRNRAAEAFQAAARAAGVPASGWHALRHHAASTLIAQGLSVTAVAATLGHSPAECLRTYAGWWPNEHEQVRAAMARAWAAPAAESRLSHGAGTEGR